MPWWRFWRPDSEEEIQAQQMQKAAIEALENGDIPATAKQRINLQLNADQHFFTSDLSVREFLLTKESGIETISQVMGTSFYNVSFWGSYMGPYRMTGELVKVTEAQKEARRLAIQRMKREAELLGASGIIGVRLHAKRSDMGSRMTEFTAYGTAVRIPGYPAGAEPFTSDLNGQDFWQLYKAGFRPKGLVMGLCSYYIWTNWKASRQMFGILGFGNSTNQEIELYTQGFYEARNRAMNALTQELYELKADGCVGMSIEHDIERIEYGSESKSFDMLVNFRAIGTAVDATQQSVQPSQRLMVLDLRKGKNGGGVVADVDAMDELRRRLMEGESLNDLLNDDNDDE